MTNNIREISMIPDMSADDVTDVTAVTGQKPLSFSETPAGGNDVTDVTPQKESLPTSKVIQPGEIPPLPELLEPHIPYEKRPCWHVYDDFTRLDNGKLMRPGTYYLYFEEDDDGAILMDKWVCSPLHIEAQTSDRRDNNFGRFLRFKDSKGRWKTWAMPMELLRASGEELRGTLLAMGVLIDPYSFRELSCYLLQTVAPKKQINCSLQTGWYGRRAYVLPDQVIGPDADQVVFQSNQAAYEEFCAAGTLPAWRENVAAQAVGNTASQVGPLVRQLKRPSSVITHGRRSVVKATMRSGKSSALFLILLKGTVTVDSLIWITKIVTRWCATEPDIGTTRTAFGRITLSLMA